MKLRTSRRKVLEIIKQNTEITGWEKEILLRPFLSDQQKIIELHAHLEKRITDLVDDDESNDDEGDFYNILELAIQRNFDLIDLYEPRS
jgi:endogenous inhibitor of DNA gyrase (YacG/DUF329 family)|tara:strand:- start:55 stop:321 length:267 start_codon:yes stop_codon:yes gene_type:complete